MKSKGYFYRNEKSVIFRRVIGEGYDTYTVIYTCEHPEQAERLACRLNIDLDSIDQLPRATAEDIPGRSSVF